MTPLILDLVNNNYFISLQMTPHPTLGQVSNNYFISVEPTSLLANVLLNKDLEGRGPGSTINGPEPLLCSVSGWPLGTENQFPSCAS